MNPYAICGAVLILAGLWTLIYIATRQPKIRINTLNLGATRKVVPSGSDNCQLRDGVCLMNESARRKPAGHERSHRGP